MKRKEKTSSQKYRARIKKLKKDTDKLWGQAILKLHPKCEFCKDAKSTDPHHFVPKSISNTLRYNTTNGIGLCRSHHFHHHCGNPFIQQRIIEQRGKKWFEYIKKEKEKIIKHTTNIKWYEDHIERLSKELIKIEKIYESKRPIK